MTQNYESQITSLDDYLENEQLYASEIPVSNDEKIIVGTTKKGRKIIVKEPTNVTDNSNIIFGEKKSVSATTNIIERGKTVSLEKKEKYGEIGTTANALSRHAKEKLENYLKKSPQFKVLEAQLTILKTELHNYKFLDRKDLSEITQNMINDLEATKNKFVKLYKNKNWKEDNKLNAEKIKNSEYLKELKIKRKELEEQYISVNPNSIISRMRSFRSLLELNFPDDYIKEDENGKIIKTFKLDDDENLDEIDNLDIDEVLDDVNFGKPTLKQEYANFCGNVADKLDLLPSEIVNMELSQVRKLLLLAIPDSVITNILNELEKVKIESANEISKLRGNQDITNVMFEIFDFSSVPEEQPKEMLAASNIEYVKGIAYNSCSKLNMMHNYDDCVAYGLLGLSIAIDAWYKIQKINDSAISFNGFAHRYVTNAIKRGMYELNSGGMISGSSMATIIHKYEKQMKSFVTNNPELKDLPKDLLEGLLDGLTSIEKPKNVVTEGEYSDIVGGSEGGDNSDIWANAVKETSEMDLTFEYDDLFKSVKQLFNLFETKVDSETGIRENTKKKLFDKFDYKLFKLKYGLEYKKTSIDGGKTTANNLYSQAEIAEIMVDYYRSFGATNIRLSQSSISTRIETLNKKLQAAIAENPGLKTGLQYIYNYIQTNCGDFNPYDENSKSEEMEEQLLAGKSINDVYQKLDDDMLDEELNDSIIY